MRKLVWAFAGRIYHIVGNLISRLIMPFVKKKSYLLSLLFTRKLMTGNAQIDHTAYVKLFNIN